MPKRIRKERWLPVVGYEGLYEVSDLGRVRSLDRVVKYPPSQRWPKGFARLSKGRMLRLSTDKDGYRKVRLYRDGKPTPVGVHRLVLEAHVGSCPPGQLARHGENGISDNSVSNLCWGTPAENNGPDRRRDGMRISGEMGGNAKLTWVQVREIKTRLAAGEKQQDIAVAYGVHQGAVSLIKLGKRWKDEDDPGD